MKPRSPYKPAVAMACLLALVKPALATPLTVPEDIQQAVHQVQDAWKETRVEDAQRIADALTNRVQDWTAESLRTTSITSVIEALKPILPLTLDPVQAHWKFNNPWHEPKHPIALNIATWRAGKRVLAVLWGDHVFRSSPKSNAYVQSTPPVVLTKDGEEVSNSGPLLGWRADFEVPPLYMVHGFVVASTKESWPDVLISCGPVGHLLYFYIVQMHFVAQPKNEWRSVWSENLPLVQVIDFDPSSQRLALEVARDRQSTETQRGVYRLVYGGAATLTKRFDQN